MARGLWLENANNIYFDNELHGNQLLVAEREAAVWPGSTVSMINFIKQIIARHHLERPLTPPARMAPTKRVKPIKHNAYAP